MANANYPPEDAGCGFPGYNIPMYGQNEANISNIVEQIDPKTIIDNLDHSLKGEIYNKEKGMWETNSSKEPLCNDACRGAIISYLTGLLTNNTTMAIIPSEDKFSDLMKSIIDSIVRMFVTNLEKFGFVPPSEGSDKEGYEYQNKGVPDTARMTLIANSVLTVAFCVMSRAVKGSESIRIFKALKLNDNMGFGQQDEPKKGIIARMFGR